MATAAQVTGNTDDPFWQAALQQFEATTRPKPPKDGFRGSLTRESQIKKVEFFNAFMNDQSSVQDARNVCKTIQAQANNQYTSQSVNLILGNLNYVITAGDLAFKGGAETIAMAWSGIKFILLAVQADRDNCASWAAAGAAISTILVACRTFGKLYRMPVGSPPMDSAAEVTGKLTPIYQSILAFSWAAKIQLDHNKAHRMFDQFNPFSSAGDASKGALEGIKGSAKDIREASNVAFQEWSKETAEKSNALQQSVKDDVKSFQSEFIEYQQKHETILESINEALLALNASAQRQEGMIKELVQAVGLRTPYEADRQRFLLNKKLLQPQEDYLRAAYASKIKIHEQRPLTCQWIFEEKIFQDWRDCPDSESKEKGILWLSGGPGYGKSILTTECIRTISQTCTTAYFYCSRIDSSDGPRTTTKIKQDLVYQLYQLTETDPALLEEANRVFAKPVNAKKTQEKSTSNPNQGIGSATGPRLPDMDDAFPALASILKRKIFLLVDALDECVDREKEKLIETLKAWAEDDRSQIRVLVSSRREPDLEGALKTLPNIRVEMHNSQDIRAHTDGELSSIPSLTAKERRLVSQAVVDRAQGQFTYVNLALNILKKPFVRPIENLINKLAANNRGMNQETLKRIDPAYADLARTCLTWTLLRQSDLSVGEIMDIFTGSYSSQETIEVTECGLSVQATLTDGVQEDDGKTTTRDSDADEKDVVVTDKAEKVEDTATDTKPVLDEVEVADNIDLYIKQIRDAAGPFLTISAKPEYYLTEEHPSVRESFRAELESDTSFHSKNGMCEACKRPHDPNAEFIVDAKFDHLKLAIQCLKHLNNPRFQERYLFDTSPRPEPSSEEIVVDGADSVAGSAEEISGETTEEKNVATPADSAVGIEDIKPKGVDGQTSDTEPPKNEETALGSEESATDAIMANGESKHADVHGTDTNRADAGTEETSKGKESENGQSSDDQTLQGIPTDEHEEGKPSDSDDWVELDDYGDSEDDDDDEADPETTNESETTDGSDSNAKPRYEIYGWTTHIKRAEELWGWNTRDIDSFNLEACEKEWDSADETIGTLWLELKDQLMFFFFSDQGGYKPWFLHTYGDTSFFTKIEERWQPLQVAAMYSLTSLAVMLCDRGESIIRRDPMYGTVPLYFLQYSDFLNESVNLLKLLSGTTSNDSAAADLCRQFVGDDMREGLTLGGALLSSKGKEGYDLTCLESLFILCDPDPNTVRTMLEIVGTCDNWDPVDKRDILHDVARSSTHPQVVALLTEQGGMDINSKYPEDMYSFTPLHILLSRTDLPEEMLEAFLKVPNIDVNAEDSDSERPLIGACKRGHMAAARRLIEAGADVNDVDLDDRTATNNVCFVGRVELLDLLAAHGGNLLQSGKSGRSPLYNACWQNKKEVALRVLELLKDETIEKVDQTTNKRRTPLRKACFNGMLEVVEALLAFPGAKERLHIVDRVDGRGPLHVAAMRGKSAVVKTLIDCGADVAVKDKHDMTALQLSFEGWALSFGGKYEETILLLLDKDPAPVATVVDKSDPTMTMVHVAAAKGSLAVLSRLMKLHFPHSTKDCHGWTPLLLAKQSKHHEAANLLESFGAETGDHPKGLCSVKSDFCTVSDDGRTLTSLREKGAVSVLSNHPIPADIDDLFYFEVTVEVMGEPDSWVALGICSDCHAESVIGWPAGFFRKGVRSYAYHCDNGCVYDSTKATARNNFVSVAELPTWKEVGKVVGCGLNVDKGTLFFTLDGEQLTTPCEDVSGRLFPILCVGVGATASINFGDKSDFAYAPANATRKT